MARHVLLRCDVCKRYHASYVVEDAEFGKRHLCTTCWKALYGSSSNLVNKEDKHDKSTPLEKNGQE
jgi:hypothetical protein